MNAPVSEPVKRFVGRVEDFLGSGGNLSSIHPRDEGLTRLIKEIDGFYVSGGPRNRHEVLGDFKVEEALSSIRPDLPPGPGAQALDAFIGHIKTRGERLPLDFGLVVSYLVFAVRQHIESGYPLIVARGREGRLAALAAPNLSDSSAAVDYLASTGAHRGGATTALASLLLKHDGAICVDAIPTAKSFYARIGFEPFTRTDDESVNMVLPVQRVREVRERVAALPLRVRQPASAQIGLE